MEEGKREDYQEAEIETPQSGHDRDKKIKNLISVIVLLAGLFVGSLFVDIIQLLSGQGFSGKALKNSSVLEAAGKTWVAYEQPLIQAKVFSSESCTECKTEDVLVWLRRMLPTIAAEKVDVNTDSGKKLAEKYGIKTIPAFVIAPEVEKTEFFEKAQQVFQKVEDNYVLNGTELGIPVGQYLSLPKIEEQDAKVGDMEAPVKLVEFSDFQCPYCKMLHDSIKKVVAEMGDKVVLVFKNLPLDIHPQAENAALAAACANEQGKFWDYSNQLFANQNTWGKTKGTAIFKNYAAQLKLNTGQFGKCLDDKKYAGLIEADKAEAEKYSISGTPAIFVNGQFKNGAVQFEDLKALIEAELKK